MDRTGRYLIVALCISLFAVVLVAALVSPWVAHRLLSDFWPLDRSYVSPNLLASVVQAVVIVIATVLLYPPLRKRLEASIERHKAEMMAHVSSENAKLHKIVQHIIKHHPDIPDYKEK